MKVHPQRFRQDIRQLIFVGLVDANTIKLRRLLFQNHAKNGTALPLLLSNFSHVGCKDQSSGFVRQNDIVRSEGQLVLADAEIRCPRFLVLGLLMNVAVLGTAVVLNFLKTVQRFKLSSYE
eukprot:XP_001707560.1 Hypothetical protein GL50803_19621 [Giardia lamblia ATCC 50803]